MMKYYLASFIFFTSLLHATYENTNSFIDGNYSEIREFNPLSFKEGALDEKSEEYLEALLETIKSYQENNTKIQLKVLGHSNARIDIYDKVIAGEKAYKKTLKNTVVFAQKVVQDLVDNGMSSEKIDIDYLNSKNLGFNDLVKEGKNLSNHVIVTMYVLASNKKEQSIHLEAEIEVQNTVVADMDKDGIEDTMDVELDTPYAYAVYKDGSAKSTRLSSSFKTNSTEVTQELEKAIMKLAQYLTKNPELEIHIVGHTSRTATSSLVYNIRLSIQRAKKIKTTLAKYGIKSKRITIDGRGFTHPIADNATKEGRMTNRRIEIEFKRKKVKEV